jgi:hypothetical protein
MGMPLSLPDGSNSLARMASLERRTRERVARRVERAASSPEPVTPASDVDAVLRLQARVGNRLTSRLIARDPRRPRSTGHTLTVAGFGEYDLSSFETKGTTALAVTFDAGRDGARLLHAATRGEPIPSVAITAGSRTITLTEVVIASYQQAGSPEGGEPLVSAEFNGASLEVK